MVLIRSAINKQRNTFATGAAVLVASAILVKLIGVCYKIPLVHLLGTQGMGYFNTAYDVYALLCIVSTTGLPVAVSTLINRYPYSRKRIFEISVCLFFTFGLIGALAVFFSADTIASWLHAPMAAQSLRFIAPAVLFVCLSSAFRGYYQANRNMVPTAISQVIEAAGKLLFGIAFAHVALSYQAGAASTAAFAVLGLSVGMLVSFLYLVFCPKKELIHSTQQDNTASVPLLMRHMLFTAFPVTLGALLSGVSKVIDLSLIMRRLQDAGFVQETAVAMYGCYSAMVVPLFGLVPALFSSVALPLVPHLCNAIARNDAKEQVNLLGLTFRWWAVITLPSSLGLSMLSRQILQLLFPGAGEIEIAVPLLILISVSIPASCLITLTSAVLQAYGHPWLPMISTAIGSVAKAFALYALCAKPDIGILAAPVSTWLCCIITVCLNLAFVSAVAPTFYFLKSLTQSLCTAVVSIMTAAILYRLVLSHLPLQSIGILGTILAAICICFTIAYKCGLIRISDIKSITHNKEKDF
ncbi:MAG: polysaccharide biosynthesis protein [Clostridia bacterium]|nr:polysaccharide biosynthesis protein [Clostridia bacterium]